MVIEVHGKVSENLGKSSKIKSQNIPPSRTAKDQDSCTIPWEDPWEEDLSIILRGPRLLRTVPSEQCPIESGQLIRTIPSQDSP